jgi:ketosteroid isomerase-like protein
MIDTLRAEDFEAWLNRYKAAWEQRDAALAGALFTEDATYREKPYDPPFEGREAIEAYWTNVVSGQRDVLFTFEILACAQKTGLCHWHTAFKSADGSQSIELDGIFRCRFATPQQVETFEEWWHVKVQPLP